MRANRDATLAMWDYMNSKAIQNKIAALNYDVKMYVFTPQEFDTTYLDFSESPEVPLLDTVEMNSYDVEGSIKDIDDTLNLAIELERESEEEWEDFDGGPEESEAY